MWSGTLLVGGLEEKQGGQAGTREGIRLAIELGFPAPIIYLDGKLILIWFETILNYHFSPSIINKEFLRASSLARLLTHIFVKNE